MSQEVNTEIRNQIGIITLGSADGLNTINRRILAELAAAATFLDMSDNVKVIVLRGNDKAFSTGFDINDFLSDTSPEALDEMYENFEKIADIKKPVIAAVSGYALGIGCEMVLACDIVFASESACFGHPDLSLGTVPGFGATQRLPNAVGKAKTMEMILTGRAMNAREAERCGIVSRIIPLRYLFAETMNTAARIAALPDLAVNTSKELIKTAVSNTNLEEGLEIEKQVYKSSISSDEFRQNLTEMAKKQS